MEFKEVISDIKIFSRKNSDYRVLLNRRHLFGFANETDRSLIIKYIRQQHLRPRKIITEYFVFKRVGGCYRYVPYMGMIYYNEYQLVMIILRNKYEVEIKTAEQPKPIIPRAVGTTFTTTSDSYNTFSTTSNI